MHYTYTPKGVCASRIDLDIEDGVIRDCKFTNGCAGNTAGVARLVVGRKPEEVISLLQDIPCRPSGASCPSQLAQALRESLEKV